jgi:drug/metabolite transporter (DMT)-like permease
MGILKWLPLFVTGAALESTTQLCLKKGAMAHRETEGLAYYLEVVRNRWVILGILAYLGEMTLWVVLLTYLPLSIAFPLTGIQKVMIVLFSVWVLKEQVAPVEWVGVGITLLGVTVIVQGG